MKTAIAVFILFIISNLSFAQGTFVDELTGLKLPYAEDWQEDEYEDMRSLITREGIVSIYTIQADTILTPDEIVATFKDDYSAFTRIFKNLLSGTTISGYGKGIIGGQEAVYLDITTPSKGDIDTSLFRIYMLDIKPYTYAFSILTLSKNKSFIERSELLLKDVIFPE